MASIWPPAPPPFFFHTATIDGRAWIVAPDGQRQLFLGIDHVRPSSWKDRTLGYDVYGRFVKTNYPSKEAWLEETIGQLQSWGFNTLANHCDEPLLRHRGLAHTVTLYLGGKFARGKDPDRWITEWRGPCTGFPNVFHPDFERVIRERARELCSPERSDPWLMGWFLDNELKWWGATVARKDLTLFDTVRALPETHSARKAQEMFRKGRPVTNALREEFLRLVAERYFSVLCGAIREADPNHMILGCRFAGPFTSVHPVVWEACGKYCDIVSFNCYPWADIDRGVVLDEKGGVPVAGRFRDIQNWCGRPIIVTEWSFPALDTGRPCYHGAGQRFPTQEGRAAASALYARTLLSLPFVAGYSYFMFLDQPASGISETFREDSNYGLVSEYGEPYQALTTALTEVQKEATEFHAGSVNHGTHGNDSWYVSNAFVRLAGSAGGERLADALAFGGVEVGSLGAMLQWRGPDGDIWSHVAPNGPPVFERDIVTGADSVTLRGIGGDAFAITIRATLAPSSRALHAEIVSVENIGDAPLQFSGVFLVPAPRGAEAKPEPVIPNLWGAPERAWWRNPDGTVWGAISDSPSARFHFWNALHGKKGGVLHADARFTTGAEPVVLAPGAAWRPASPMQASIGLRGEGSR